ncbi:hypothetical protein ACH41H_25120 [Streptomyces sp. NPDC020800]|uniref:hypothetical protein n=1 Tax=Streptomyces sp. NPDC020800 TaxID=3365092 RepID=UPI00378E233A
MAEVRLGGCVGCAGSIRPGFIYPYEEQPDGSWKSVEKRCPEGCTAQSRQEAIARQQRARVAQEQESPAPAAPTPAEPAAVEPMRHAATPNPAPAYRGRPSPADNRRAAPRRDPATRTTPATAGTPHRWPAVALDVTDEGWALDIDQVPPPAGMKLTDWFGWLGTGLPLRVERIHAAGRAGDGIVCLTSAALKKLGLPAALPATDKALAQLHKKLSTAAASVGMELSDEIGPTIHVFRRKGSAGGPKTSVRILFTPWLGQGTDKQKATNQLALEMAANDHGQPDAPVLARRIRAFVADLGIAPGSTHATTSMLLLDAVRPREEAVQNDETGEWSRQLRDGALPSGDTAVPPAAGARHPLTRELTKKDEAVCQEEDFKYWARPLTDGEAALPYAVVIDACASYLSVTETLPLPAGPLQYTSNPAWDPKTAGLWWCDFTAVEVDALLPHPATFHGAHPTGPGWYATPTVTYMVNTYGYDPKIAAAYLSSHTVPLLKEWTGRLRTAYKRAYADLGLTDGQDAQDFLDAYAVHKDTAGDPQRADAALLASFYKSVYKGGIGKWTASARTSIPDDEVWLQKTVSKWSYRPEIRFTIIAAARIAAHRRMRKTYQLTGRAPFAVNVDASFYATAEPTPLELFVLGDNGKPVPGTLRPGIAPGSCKHESSIPMKAVITLLDNHEHPARIAHDYDTAGQPVDAGEQQEESTQ